MKIKKKRVVYGLGVAVLAAAGVYVFSGSKGASAPSGAALPGEIRKSSYLGKHIEYGVHTAVGELFVVDHERGEPLASGTPVWISFSTKGVVIVPTR